MPIRLALSTLTLPDADLSAALTTAAAAGYVALDLWSDDLASRRHPADPGLSDPWRVRDACKDAGLAIACLSTPQIIGDPSDSAADLERRWVAHYAARAAAIGSPRLCVVPAPIRKGMDISTYLRRLADQAAACAAAAQAQGVALLVANDQALAHARHAWALCNLADDQLTCGQAPPVRIAWRPQPGESPSAALPVLNSLIGLVRLDDAEVPVAREVVQRLCGLGYDGDVVFAPQEAPAQRIPAAAAAVKSWLEVIATQRAAADAAAGKAAAKLKPAPAAPLRAPPAAAAATTTG
jgi:hypothetical protein